MLCRADIPTDLSAYVHDEIIDRGRDFSNQPGHRLAIAGQGPYASAGRALGHDIAWLKPIERLSEAVGLCGCPDVNISNAFAVALDDARACLGCLRKRLDGTYRQHLISETGSKSASKSYCSG